MIRAERTVRHGAPEQLESVVPLQHGRRNAGRSRLVGIDVARCLALLGMMVAHIVPKAVGGRVPVAQRLTTGTSAALFAVLAGVSLALLTGGHAPHRGHTRLTDSVAIGVRALMILMIGFLLEQLHPAGIAVILPYYALLFVLGLPLLWLRPPQLFLLGGIWICAAPVVSQAFRLLHPTSVAGGFGGLGPVAVLLRLLVTGEYPAFTWLSYLCFGLAIGRMDLRRTRSAVHLLCGGAVLIAGATFMSGAITSRNEVRSRLMQSWPGPPVSTWDVLQPHLQVGLEGVTPTHSWWWLAVNAPHSGSVADLAFTTGTALLIIGAALVLTRVATRWWQVAFGAGSMTLSLYSLHLVMVLPQTWPDYGPRRLLPEVLVVCVIGAVFAGLRRKGPLESLVTFISRTCARWTTRLLRLG